MKIEVSVIIVNYNTRKMTQNCIDSVFAFSSNRIEIILVDNASEDDSLDFFSSDSRITYIYNRENIGFGRANNVGVEAARGKYIFLLNSDTIFLDDVIRKIFDFAELRLRGDFGAIGTRLVDERLEDTMSFSQFLTPSRIYGKIFERLRLNQSGTNLKSYLKLDKNGILEVDFVIGAALFMRKDIFLSEKGFDPDFFMYYEETDLQLRLAKKGLKRYILNVKDIVHLEGGSFGASIPFRRKMMMTNGMKLYVNKHFKGIARWHILSLVLLTLVKDLRILNYSMNENLLLIKQVLK